MKNTGKINHLFYYLFLILAVAFMQSCMVNNPEHLATLPVSDVVRMSKDGVSSKAIIGEMRKSHSVYMLPANKLAELKSEGVQDSVLNYMQRTHLNAIRQEQRMEDYYYGYPGMYGYPYYGFGYGWPYGYWGSGWGWDFGPAIIIHRNGPEHHAGIQRSNSGRR